MPGIVHDDPIERGDRHDERHQREIRLQADERAELLLEGGARRRDRPKRREPVDVLRQRARHGPEREHEGQRRGDRGEVGDRGAQRAPRAQRRIEHELAKADECGAGEAGDQDVHLHGPDGGAHDAEHEMRHAGPAVAQRADRGVAGGHDERRYVAPDEWHTERVDDVEAPDHDERQQAQRDA